MDGNKVHVGGEDMGDGMACNFHPFNNNPGGICAFCLQEKLGKLVSSSFPALPIHASPSSPTPLRSDTCGGIGNSTADNGRAGTETSSSTSSLSVSLSAQASSGKSRIDYNYNEYHHSRRARIPFLLAKKDQKKKKKIMVTSNTSDLAFNTSKSITPRIGHFMDADNGNEYSPRKKAGFWSFMHLSLKSNISKKIDKCSRETRNNTALPTTAAEGARGSYLVKPRDDKSIVSVGDNSIMEDDDDSPESQANASDSASSFERKVSRSRSVGCGSRRFSGDFLERFSTGPGDCTLRRVESHREGKLPNSSNMHRGSSSMKERAKCGGIFTGFLMTSLSSSYLISSCSAERQIGQHGKSNRSWNWALASPMRAFSKPFKDGKRNVITEANASENTAPNLAAIPSLLAVRG